jgi:hypothetical protein
LLFEDNMENERRIKMLRHQFHTAMMNKELNKGKKIGEMKRIWINPKKETVQTLYGNMGV